MRLLIFAIAASLLAQSPPLDNAGVVAMVRGKVAQDLIIAKIAESQPQFQLDTSNLIGLTNAGVPDDVIRAMAARQNGKTPTAPNVSVPLLSEGSAAPTGRMTAGSKLFIAPMVSGLDGFIAAEIIKRKLQFVLVTDERQAEYILAGASIKADDHWYNTVFGGKDKNEGNIRIMDARARNIIWAGEAGDRSLWMTGFRRGGQRKVADRLVKQMKNAFK